MYFSLVFTIILFCLTSYNCQKLVCGGKALHNHEYGFDHVGVSYKNKDSKSFNFTNLEDFDASRKTVLIIHGLSYSESTYQWAFKMGKKWFEREPVNAIIVQWTSSIVGEFYKKTSFSTEYVASKISEKILELFKSYGPRLNTNFHFIGLSLGAHVAGQTARLLKNSKILVQRVTALDPAYPCFENESASLRVRKSDAEFVDVYHTNCDPEENKGNLGIYDLIGHADFYFNGGNHQPDVGNCEEIIDIFEKKIKSFNLVSYAESLAGFFKPQTGIDDMESIVKKALEGDSFCSHRSAAYYYIESLDRNIPIRWGNPTDYPVNVTDDLKCQNRRCDRKTCIKVGINAEQYSNSPLLQPGKAFYVDTWNEVMNCAS